MQLETVKLAFEALGRNRLRSLLTMLGVVIGVSAVIAMVSIGRGASQEVRNQISLLGPNLMTLKAGQTLRGGAGASQISIPFLAEDVTALQRQVGGLRALGPLSTTEARLASGKRNWLATIAGTENDYFRARNWAMAAGRSFSGHESAAGKSVCIIGHRVLTQFFAERNALGEMMRVGSVPCTVIGILAARGQSGADVDDDNMVFLPFKAFQRRVQGTPDVQSIIMELYPGAEGEWVRSQIRSLMRERRALTQSEPDDFTILDMRQVSNAMTSTASTMTTFLGLIAAVSLLVGGIGIMNIMLVSIAERTKEIGVSLAIGALPRQIMLQFLIEAVTLSVAGGAAGALLGIAVAAGLSSVTGLPFVLDAAMIVVAISVSILTGLIFGYGPAARAAQLNPIDALRMG